MELIGPFVRRLVAVDLHDCLPQREVGKVDPLQKRLGRWFGRDPFLISEQAVSASTAISVPGPARKDACLPGQT